MSSMNPESEYEGIIEELKQLNLKSTLTTADDVNKYRIIAMKLGITFYNIH
jgi:hypothetical protein